MVNNFLLLRLNNIKLIVFDFDGVMTDNRVIVSETGEESVIVNRADGLGIKMLREKGVPMLILSTEENRVVTARGKKLKLPVLQGISDKASALKDYCRELNVDLNKVMYIGNDINDLEVMKLVGLRLAPADAHIKIKEITDMVLSTPGGGGVIRELADIICSQ